MSAPGDGLDGGRPEGCGLGPWDALMVGAVAAWLFGGAAILEADREAVTVDLDGVRATFRACPHPLLEPATPFRGCAVAGLRDLALLEIAAIARGGRREDFVDLYALLQGRLSLERLLFDDLPRKFGAALRPADGLRALAWFDRAVTDPPMTLHGLPIVAVVEEPGPADDPTGEWLRPVEWREVEAFFNAWVRALLPRVGRAPRGGRPG